MENSLVQKKKVIVIGGGAAGMMAALIAAQDGHAVILLEKNEKLGKKLFITGKGRCNVTNACDEDEFFCQIVHNPKFMYSSFDRCSNSLVQSFFEMWKVPLKVERGGRVFPMSDKSSDIIRALECQLRDFCVDIRLHTCVKKLILDLEGQEAKGGEAPMKICRGVILEDGSRLLAEHVIVATGGCSYASTGSTGDGYRFAADCGLDLTPRYPSLVPFRAAEPFCKALQGISLKNVSVRLVCENQCVYEGFGEMLFTHFGVSGPLILSASAYATSLLAKRKKMLLHIDLKPALSEEQLDQRLLRELEKNRFKQFRHAVASFLPQKLLEVVLERSGIPAQKRGGEITKKERERFLALLKDFSVTVLETMGFNEAIITQGGVNVKEISPATMRAKRVKGLSFAGEVLDLDALTGGFNLQIAWSTGYAAGASVSEHIEKERV